MRTIRLSLAAVVAVTALAACAGPEEEAESTDSPSSTPSSTPSSSPTTTPAEPTSAPPSTPEPAGPELAVVIEGDDVSPNAEEIDLEAGEPLLVTVQADRAGELHVHSKPEQYIEFEAGRSRQELVVETPGTVEIEDHDTGAVVAVVEVR